MSINVVESNTVETITEAIALKVNSNVPHHLSRFFYINKKNKISYYRKDAWGSLETWNAGAKTWEYSPGMNNSTLIKLPACAFKTTSESTVEVTKVTTKAASLPELTSRSVNIPQAISTVSQHPTMSDIQKEAISSRAKQLSQESVGRRITTQIDTVTQPPKLSLPILIAKHNVHKYPTTFVEGENNYAFAYMFEKETWETQLRINYMAGAITVTSKTCAKAVVKELNDLGIKPDQI